MFSKAPGNTWIEERKAQIKIEAKRAYDKGDLLKVFRAEVTYDELEDFEKQWKKYNKRKAQKFVKGVTIPL